MQCNPAEADSFNAMFRGRSHPPAGQAQSGGANAVGDQLDAQKDAEAYRGRSGKAGHDHEPDDQRRSPGNEDSNLEFGFINSPADDKLKNSRNNKHDAQYQCQSDETGKRSTEKIDTYQNSNNTDKKRP